MYRNTHKRRKPRGQDYGAAWISYSDMTAALLVIFVMVLIYSIYQYFIVMEVKTKEISEKEAMLSAQQATLDEQEALLAAQLAKINEQEGTLSSQQDTLESQNTEIITKASELAEAQSKLSEQQAQLDALSVKLEEQQKQLDIQAATLASTAKELDSKNAQLTAAQADLAQRERDLNSTLVQVAKQEDMLRTQQERIDELVGVKTSIIQDLSLALRQNNLKATVDSKTGDIVLESAIFFDTGKFGIKRSGLQLLNKFLPVYFDVLTRKEYIDFLGEIIIEGHTDTVGTYINNLELSQQRALSVVKAALQLDGLTEAQRELMRSIITAKGKSFSSPILNADGTVNLDASRRVEFKFRLKDSEMISEINEILNNMPSPAPKEGE